MNEAQVWEKRRQKIEAVREQKRKFEEQMKLLDWEEKQLQQSNGQEMDNLSRAFTRTSLSTAPVSEPTTPPEFVESAFPSSLSKPGRYSMGIMSPPGLPNPSNRFSQSSINVSSPPTSKLPPSSQPQAQTHRMSIKSMPGSRRDSEEEDLYEEELRPVRASNSNRFSMPATGARNSNRLSTVSSGSGVTGLGSNSFFPDGDDEKSAKANNPVDFSSADAKLYMQMTAVDDAFPTLRSDVTSGGLHANSAAVDLANAKEADTEAWASYARPRPSHQSMPQNGLNMFSLQSQISSPPGEKSEFSGLDKKSQRHSAGFGFKSAYETPVTPARSAASSRPVSLQSSYSTNDLPTVKSTAVGASTATPPKTHAEQHLQNHNASIGRFPAGAVSSRQSRDLSNLMSPELKREDRNQVPLQAVSHPTMTAVNASSLQANAPTFGPTAVPNSGLTNGNSYSQTNGAISSQSYYQYAMPQQFNGMPNGYGQVNAFNPAAGYGQYQNYITNNRQLEATGQGGKGRRYGSEDNVRFNNAPLETFLGDLYNVCKDQHGCRYLQRKLEEKNPETIEAIFSETRPHIAELMTDPFGNYLCQKLFEYCNREQRTALIEAAAPSMVEIALNQHGTRALQKMIEYVDTPEQVQTVTIGLQREVVRLVQDLNGNHVVQKCLNRLSNQDAQFIYDAAGADCVRIGTHRHGCCVLQRCIDHANDEQRAALIAKITQDAFDLVQDPFGNYVVQYILDLNEEQFTTPLCLSFCGNISPLSKQKFSSNVIEKCLRTSQLDVKRRMVDEMLLPGEMEKLLKDSYANYVVQTALDYVDSDTKTRMTESIRPILPAIKQTPHGRRIASKIVASDATGRLSGSSSGQATPNELSSPSFTSARQNNVASGRRQFQIYGSNIFQGANATPRYMGNREGVENGAFSNGNYQNMNNGQANYNNMFSAPSQHAAPTAQQQGFQAYAGSQPGPGYF